MKKNFYWLGYAGIIILVIMTIGCFVTGDKFNGLLNLVWCGNAFVFIAGIRKAHKVNAMKDQLIETYQNKIKNIYPECNGRLLDKQISIDKDTAECPWSKEEKDAYKEGMRSAYTQSREIILNVLENIEKEPDIEDYLSRPGTIFKIHECPSAMYMSLGIQNGQVVCCNGIDIKTGQTLKQMDGNATMPTADEVEEYWRQFKKILK